MMNWNSISIREIRKFGVVAIIFFGGLCALGLWLKKLFPAYLFGFLALLGLGFILIPSWLRPVYFAWLQIAHFLGGIVTTLIFILAYYLVITPFSLMMRLFGGHQLPIRPDKKASSYWVIRTESAQPKERFLKRY